MNYVISEQYRHYTAFYCGIVMPYGIIWLHRSWSPLVQAMAYCLMTPSHHIKQHIDGLAQDCSISIAYAQEIWQSCTKPLIYFLSIGPLGAHFGEKPNQNTQIFFQEDSFESVVPRMAAVFFKPQFFLYKQPTKLGVDRSRHLRDLWEESLADI